jgi:hypothetical protein
MAEKANEKKESKVKTWAFKHSTHPNVTGEIFFYDSEGNEKKLSIKEGRLETNDVKDVLVLEKEGFIPA